MIGVDNNDQIEHQLFKLLRRTNAIHVQTSSGEIELERSAYAILCLLADDGPQRLGSIATAFRLDPSTITRQVQAVERLGLAAKSSDPADRRAALLHLTDSRPRRRRDRPRPPAPDARRDPRRLVGRPSASDFLKALTAVQRHHRRLDRARRRPRTLTRSALDVLQRAQAALEVPLEVRRHQAGGLAQVPRLGGVHDRPVAGQQRAEEYDGLARPGSAEPGSRQSAHSTPPADGLNQRCGPSTPQRAQPSNDGA